LSKVRESYDWVVLGDNPGALLSAALVARMGLSVLVLPFNPGAHAYVSKSGQCFDPEPNFIIGLGRMEQNRALVSECLHKLGMLPSEASRIIREGALPQAVTPSHRLALCHDDEQFQREIDREFGQNAVAAGFAARALARAEMPVRAFWRALPDRLTLLPPKAKRPADEPRSIRDVMKNLSRAARHMPSARGELVWFADRLDLDGFAESKKLEGFTEVMRALSHGIGGGNGADAPLLSELLHILVAGRTGASFQGGVTAYREFLLRLAKRLGAHVPPKWECKRLFVEKGRLIGAQVAGRGNVVGVKGGVLGCSLDHAREYISFSGRRGGRMLKYSPKSAGWRFTVALTVHAEAVPPGMSPRIVWQEEGAPALEAEIVNPADYGSAESGVKWIFMRAALAFDRETLKVGALRMTAARMLRQMTEIMPFLEYHIVRIYPDFRTDNKEISEAYSYAALEYIPDNMRFCDGKGIGSNTGVEGLFAVSGESYPALGSFGQTVAALESAAWIAHRSGLAGPLA